MSEPTRTYTSEGIIVEWRPELCVHCKNCHIGLPAVFNPERRPWVDLTAAPGGQIVRQVEQCPSGALSVKGV